MTWLTGDIGNQTCGVKTWTSGKPELQVHSQLSTEICYLISRGEMAEHCFLSMKILSIMWTLTGHYRALFATYVRAVSKCFLVWTNFRILDYGRNSFEWSVGHCVFLVHWLLHTLPFQIHRRQQSSQYLLIFSSHFQL